jgi:SSS family solute:Na+ symporter
MSIAAGNLVTRNIYRRYIRPDAGPADESQVAKLVSLAVKFGAVACILIVPQQYAINLQLLGGVCILQTFPCIAVGLYSSWLHHRALLAGWIAGMVLGVSMVSAEHFTAIYPLQLGTSTVPVYTALAALAGNIAVAIVLTPVFDALHVPRKAAAHASAVAAGSL